MLSNLFSRRAFAGRFASLVSGLGLAAAFRVHIPPHGSADEDASLERVAHFLSVPPRHRRHQRAAGRGRLAVPVGHLDRGQHPAAVAVVDQHGAGGVVGRGRAHELKDAALRADVDRQRTRERRLAAVGG